jgi:hypothetical protein
MTTTATVAPTAALAARLPTNDYTRRLRPACNRGTSVAHLDTSTTDWSQHRTVTGRRQPYLWACRGVRFLGPP